MKFDLKSVRWDRVILILLGAIAVLVLSSWINKVFAANVTVEWTHPTQRVDGTPIAVTEIKETVIAWGLDVANPTFPNERTVAAPAATFVVDIAPNKWCFRAASRDVDGLTSDWTGPVCVNLRANPKQPVIIKITRAAL